MSKHTKTRLLTQFDVPRGASNCSGMIGCANANITFRNCVVAGLVKAKKDAVVGFYLAANGKAIPEGKAYLEIAGGSAKALIFNFGEENADAISNVEAAPAGSTIYNLAGQRIQKTQKGLNIVNGRKVIF